MGWRQPAEGLVFSGRRPNSPASSQPRPAPRPAHDRGQVLETNRLAGELADRSASGEDLLEHPGLLRAGPGCDGPPPHLRPAVALEFGRRPLRREARLKEAINSGRGPQVGNVPGGQVILSGGEVLFPGFDARDAPSAFAFRNQQAEAPKPTDAPQHGPSIVVRQRVGDSRGLPGTAERIQEKNRFGRDGESLSAAKFLDKELPLTPGNQEVGISDEPVQSGGGYFFFFEVFPGQNVGDWGAPFFLPVFRFAVAFIFFAGISSSSDSGHRIPDARYRSDEARMIEYARVSPEASSAAVRRRP